MRYSLILLAVFLAACIGGPSAADIDATIQAAVAATVEAIPTATPYPTATPPPTATPEPQTRQPQDVIDGWIAAGLEVELVTRLKDGEVPPGGVSGLSFKAPEACGDCGGKVVIFARPVDARKWDDLWIDIWGDDIPTAYYDDAIWVQINSAIDPAIVAEYLKQ